CNLKLFFSLKNLLIVASSSSVIATTISPLFAVVCCLTITLSPSNIPALIILSPSTTRTNKLSLSCALELGTGTYSSIFSTVVIGNQDVTLPIIGLYLAVTFSMSYSEYKSIILIVLIYICFCISSSYFLLIS